MSAFAMQNSLKGNFHEVAAAIIIEKTTKSKIDPLSLAGLLGLQSQTQSLLLRRVWFGTDKTTYEQDLHKSVLDLYHEQQGSLKLYEKFEVTAAIAPKQAMSKEELQEVVTETLQEDINPSIELDLNAENYERQIKMNVPFVKLQKFLLRAANVLDQHAAGVIREVKIAHAPIHDRNKARVGKVLPLI